MRSLLLALKHLLRNVGVCYTPESSIFWLMLSTYQGYFTGKQCWCDSFGAFLKKIGKPENSTFINYRNSQPRAQAKLVSNRSGTPQHLHAGEIDDIWHTHLGVRTWCYYSDANVYNEIWPFDLTWALPEIRSSAALYFNTSIISFNLKRSNFWQITSQIMWWRWKWWHNEGEKGIRENLVQIPEHKSGKSALFSVAATERKCKS